jgi:hypothetical protein
MLRKLLFISLFALIILFSVFPTTSAQETPPSVDRSEYELLAPIPYVEITEEGKTTAQQYIPGAVKLVIVLSGVLAVVMIIAGGVQYISTEAFTGKGDARTTINNALWGLGLVLGSFVLLSTVNPKLLEFDLSLERLAPPTVDNPEVDEPNVPDEPDVPPLPPGEGGGGVSDGRGGRRTFGWTVPRGTPMPGGPCIYQGGTPRSGGRYPACPSDTPTMIDVRVAFPNENIRCTDPGPCKIDRRAVPVLERFIANAKRYGISWQIIDAYPPTNGRGRNPNCHYYGGCIDIQAIPHSPAGYVKLCRALLDSRMSLYNEVGPQFATPDVVAACWDVNHMMDRDSRGYGHIHTWF